MPAYPPTERGVLVLEREVPVAPAPLTECVQETLDLCPAGLHAQVPSAPTASTPIQREAEEIAGTGAFPLHLTGLRPGERDQTGLLRVQSEPVLRHALVQYHSHALSVFRLLEANDEIIGVPNQPCPASQPGLDVALEPEVEHVVQVHVAEHRGDDPAYAIDNPNPDQRPWGQWSA
jgi:hypothetical protein